jgi:hypothetical protein
MKETLPPNITPNCADQRVPIPHKHHQEPGLSTLSNCIRLEQQQRYYVTIHISQRLELLGYGTQVSPKYEQSKIAVEGIATHTYNLLTLASYLW